MFLNFTASRYAFSSARVGLKKTKATWHDAAGRAGSDVPRASSRPVTSDAGAAPLVPLMLRRSWDFLCKKYFWALAKPLAIASFWIDSFHPPKKINNQHTEEKSNKKSSSYAKNYQEPKQSIKFTNCSYNHDTFHSVWIRYHSSGHRHNPISDSNHALNNRTKKNHGKNN